jgi:hypothetical protein
VVSHPFCLLTMLLIASTASAMNSEDAEARLRMARPAIRTLLDECDATGITVEVLPELLDLSRQYPDDTCGCKKPCAAWLP